VITPRAGRTTPSPDRDQRAVSDLGTLTDQREHWAATFAAHPRMYGADPSSAAIDAAQRFENAGVTTVLELGAGQGRDTLYFAKLGFDIIALDYANSGVDEIRATADRARLVERIIPVQHDVRDPLPFTDTTFDACYSHMLFCMALTNGELVVRRPIDRAGSSRPNARPAR